MLLAALVGIANAMWEAQFPYGGEEEAQNVFVATT